MICIILYRDLKPGDQIGVAHIQETGADIRIIYFHHGIYLGLKEGVIDFSGWGEIRQKPIDDFIVSGKRIVRIQWNYDVVSEIGGEYIAPEEVMSTAKHLMNNPEEWGKFKLNASNCQHFATYCKIGVAKSMYAEKAAEKVFQFCKKQVHSNWQFSSIASSSGYVCEKFQRASVKFEL